MTEYYIIIFIDFCFYKFRIIFIIFFNITNLNAFFEIMFCKMRIFTSFFDNWRVLSR